MDYFILINFIACKLIYSWFKRWTFRRIEVRSLFTCIAPLVLLVHPEIVTLGGDSGSQIDLRWKQVRPVRDRWPRVDTFFHRVTCKGIKIPHPRFYRHRGMSRRMFRRRGKSVLL